MIYVYLDKYYSLKEIISENTPRASDGNVNHIYIYVDNDDLPSAITSQFIRQGLTSPITPTGSLVPTTTKVGKELPEDRNMSYFSYSHTYEVSGEAKTGYLFYDIPIPDTLFDGITLGANLLAQAIVTMTIDGEVRGLDIVPFTVKSTGIILDGSINESQYKYLLSLLAVGTGIKVITNISATSGSAAWSEVPMNSILFDTADNVFYKKIADTGTKYIIQAKYLETYDANTVRGYTNTVSDVSDLETNQIVLVRDATNNVVALKYKDVTTLLETIIDKAKADQNGDVIDLTYLKLSGGKMSGNIDMDGKRIIKLPEPIGDYQASNKKYTDDKVNTEATTRGNADTALQGQIDVHTTNITNLQADVQRIEDSKNIADIVGTYANLVTYDVTKLALNDIIEVLADENRPSPDTGATTMYRLTAKTGAAGSWTYIGKINVPEGQITAHYLRRDGTNSMTGNLNIDSHYIENLVMKVNPVNTDATNVTFVNNKAFRVIDGTDTYDLYFDVSGADGKIIGVKR